MSSTMVKCILHCLKDPEKNIELYHKIKTIIGRNPHSKIEDKRCSKYQVEVTADFLTRTIHVQQLGSNPSCINDKPLSKNGTGILNDGDILYVLIGRYAYKVEFLPQSTELQNIENNDKKKANKKIKLSDDKELDSDELEEQRLKRIKMQLENLKTLPKTISSNDALRNKQASIVVSVSEKKLIKTRPLTKSIWEEKDSLLIYSSVHLEARSKISAFDLDGTLICTKSGKVFPTDLNDWRILFPEVKGKLKRLIQDGFKIVIFTNQRGITIGKTKIPDFKSKIEKIIDALGVPAQVFVSFKNDIFRKPAPGMWNYLVEKSNDGIDINLNNSFYVGDAAGREAKWAPGKKKDFSISDRLFAINLQLPFHTPEEFFFNWKPVPFKMPDFDPAFQIDISGGDDGWQGGQMLTGLMLGEYKRKLFEDKKSLCDPSDANLISSEKEIVILVGYPASGKSFFTKHYMTPKGYQSVNRDILGSWQKCVSACKEAIKKGKSVVIDNTNLDVESRERYITCAKEANIRCRCFLFTATFDQAMHNNQFRILSDPDNANKAVNVLVLNSFKSKFVAPALSEGFSEIIRINFLPKFTNNNLEKLYKMFLG